MHCKNHPETAATTRCTGCAESFCKDCVVELAGQNYCAGCKVMALGDRTLVAEQATKTCKEANSALTMSIIGLVLCSVVVSLWGAILVIAAIVSAVTARKKIAADVRLTGTGRATAAIIVASAGIANGLANLVNLVRTS